MAETYLAFDLHNGYDWNAKQQDRIWQFQEGVVKPEDKVIYGGDTNELAWLTLEELLANKNYQRFRANLHGDEDFVEGNHDYDMGAYLGINMIPYYWLKDIVLVLHGHQFDNYADTEWKRFYYRFAPWIRDFWFESPWQQKMHDENGWQSHNWTICGTAIRLLEQLDVAQIVIGHIHDSYNVERFELNRTFTAIGSLPEDGVYGKFVNGRVVEMRL